VHDALLELIRQMPILVYTLFGKVVSHPAGVTVFGQSDFPVYNNLITRQLSRIEWVEAVDSNKLALSY
jgi:hypothetical protein